jgi:2,3-bisphosphoglycerate-independent phosphoglycerate mutase
LPLTITFSYANIETEKYAHVTFFFNGGIEKQFKGEERHLIESPKVATYDKLPKMSVQGVADQVAEVVRAKEHEFIMCNFAPPDMVRVNCILFVLAGHIHNTRS